MSTVKSTLLALLSITLLGACGLKGPLYLPEDEAAVPAAGEPDSGTRDNAKKKENGADSPVP